MLNGDTPVRCASIQQASKEAEGASARLTRGQAATAIYLSWRQIHLAHHQPRLSVMAISIAIEPQSSGH